MNGNDKRNKRYLLHLMEWVSFLGVPGMARIQLVISQPQVFTAKCSESQVVNSEVEDGGSGVAIISSVRIEIGYKAKWWMKLPNKMKFKS